MIDENLEERNQRVMQLFIAGATYKQIAAAVGIDTVTDVHQIVCQEMSDSSQRRTTLHTEFKAVFQERAEALFKAHWAPALRGDHKSAEICRKLLDQQAKVFSDPAFRTVDAKGDVVDEIASRRAARRAGSTAYSSRTAK